jgi:hypothetical protein
MPQSAKIAGRYCINVKEDEITIASRDFEGWRTAELTPEEKKQIEDYRKKLEAKQTMEADEKLFKEINSNRAKIITPKSPDCGAANSVSTPR